MPRKPRFAPPGYLLHITQRGNYRQRTFFSRGDHLSFFDILARQADTHRVDILAYCLMPNHFHLIARGHLPDSISRFMQGLNGQYAQYLHGRLLRRGRLWQGRFYSCVLSDAHFLAALRYVELNPVRAGLVESAVAFTWSSAAVHSGVVDTTIPDWFDVNTFAQHFTMDEWRNKLSQGQSREERAEIRRATQTEVPLGDSAFVARLESGFQVSLQPKPIGRPTKKPPAAVSFGSVTGRAAASGQ